MSAHKVDSGEDPVTVRTKASSAGIFHTVYFWFPSVPPENTAGRARLSSQCMNFCNCLHKVDWVTLAEQEILNDMIPQDTTHLIHKPCYQQGSLCKDPAGNWTTRRPPDDRKETQNCSGMVMFPVHQVWPKPCCKAQ